MYFYIILVYSFGLFELLKRIDNCNKKRTVNMFAYFWPFLRENFNGGGGGSSIPLIMLFK